MAKSSTRPSSIKTLTIIKSRDIIANKLLKPCVEENHSKCTGWAVLRRELSPINANYFLRCICPCHKNKTVSSASKMKKVKQKHLQIKIKRQKKSSKMTRKGKKRK